MILNYIHVHCAKWSANHCKIYITSEKGYGVVPSLLHHSQLMLTRKLNPGTLEGAVGKLAALAGYADPARLGKLYIAMAMAR